MVVASTGRDDDSRLASQDPVTSRRVAMDGSEGRLSVGREAGRPAAPTKSLGSVGGWDPNDIQGISFAQKEGFQKVELAQGSEYCGLLSAEEHAHR